MINIEKINAFFYQMAGQVIRFRYVNLVVFLVLIGIALFGILNIRPDASWDS